MSDMGGFTPAQIKAQLRNRGLTYGSIIHPSTVRGKADLGGDDVSSGTSNSDSEATSERGDEGGKDAEVGGIESEATGSEGEADVDEDGENVMTKVKQKGGKIYSDMDGKGERDSEGSDSGTELVKRKGSGTGGALVNDTAAQ